MLLFLLFICSESIAQKSKRIKWEEMEEMMGDSTDSLTVINFWATWCKPCLEELPFFERIRLKTKDKPVRFWYISLDFAEQQKTKLDPFIKARMPGAKVFLLDETNYDKWITKIDSSWQGSIPVTLVVNNSKKIRKFHNSELNEVQLNEIISSLL